MSKLNIDQQTIFQLFSDKKSDFIIPDYQRPYAWGDDECLTLWDDIFSFAFPSDDYTCFDQENDEYFLGPIVTFRNESNKLEIIDGQQRLTTLMLLLRAFYKRFENMKDSNSMTTRQNIAKCIWKTDEFGNLRIDCLKIDSEVVSDDDKNEFLEILKTGESKNYYKSQYSKVFKLFLNKIEDFIKDYPSYCAYLPARIMNNCILLPIEAESQDTALRIFSTLNDRGKPLSDSDIFKAQFYKYYSDKNEKDIFIKKWKDLENLTEKIFSSKAYSSMDELFTRYMYYERAKKGIKSTTTDSLRKFYEQGKYELLKRDETFNNLNTLANFWKMIYEQDADNFSFDVLKKLFVLKYAPNGMWAYILSVYFMKNKDDNGKLNNDELLKFLTRITAFIYAYYFTNPGVNALRTPLYPEMVKIVKGDCIGIDAYKFDRDELKRKIYDFSFVNKKIITKSILIWYMMEDFDQDLIDYDVDLEIEHICSKNRYENDKDFLDNKLIDSLGNKALLEKKINVRASDYRFEDKKKYYLGQKDKNKQATKNHELRLMAENKVDFTKKDIENRKEKIINSFIKFVESNNLIKE